MNLCAGVVWSMQDIPGLDEFTTNTGDKKQQQLTLHGKIGNLPASDVELEIQGGKKPRIILRGTVHENMFYGPKLELKTELSLDQGWDQFVVKDELTNNGGQDQEFEIIYHTNYGKPLLEEGAEVITPVKKLTPMNAEAAKGLKNWQVYGKPTAGFTEQVHLIEPQVNPGNLTAVMLKNKTGDKGASILWNATQLPHLTVWKNTAAEKDGYVTGLEPGTSYPFNRKVERHFGRIPVLKPNETRTFRLIFSFFTTKERVSEIEGEIKKMMKSPFL